MPQVRIRRRAADSRDQLTGIAAALGVVAVGALAIGAIAIGRLAVRRMKIERGSIDQLSIGELDVGRLRVREWVAADESGAMSRGDS